MAKYNENKPVHTGDPVVEAKRACIEHRAYWMALILDEVRKAGGDMEKVGRAAINRFGCFQINENFKDKMTDPMSMKEFGAQFVAEPITFENKTVEITDDVMHVEMHYCPLLNAWRKLGFSDEDCALFCDIAMEGDRQFARDMDCEFALTKKIAEGDDCCDLCFTRKK